MNKIERKPCNIFEFAVQDIDVSKAGSANFMTTARDTDISHLLPIGMVNQPSPVLAAQQVGANQFQAAQPAGKPMLRVIVVLKRKGTVPADHIVVQEPN